MIPTRQFCSFHVLETLCLTVCVHYFAQLHPAPLQISLFITDVMQVAQMITRSGWLTTTSLNYLLLTNVLVPADRADERPQTRGSYQTGSWHPSSYAPHGDWTVLNISPPRRVSRSLSVHFSAVRTRMRNSKDLEDMSNNLTQNWNQSVS